MNTLPSTRPPLVRQVKRKGAGIEIGPAQHLPKPMGCFVAAWHDGVKCCAVLWRNGRILTLLELGEAREVALKNLESRLLAALA